MQCQNERSQHKNRDGAMKQLRARLYEFEMEKKREETRKTEATKLEINFGSQIRSYVLAPYRLIKDHRTKLSIGDVDRVLDGDLDPLIHLTWSFAKPAAPKAKATTTSPTDVPTGRYRIRRQPSAPRWTACGVSYRNRLRTWRKRAR